MRYSTSSNFLRLLLIHILAVAPLWLTAQENAHLLSVDELFRLGTENSLQLKKIKLQEVIYNDQKKSAYTDRLPDIQVGASAGIIGQPVIFQRGLSHPVRPETPDWSQNYNINLTQPLYQGGKIQAKIHQAELKKQIAALNSADNEDTTGAVYIDGKTWTARSEDGDVIARGSMVTIVRMEGVKLFVRKEREEP